jgi:thiamine-phosphate pyrophosphorylase
MSINEKLNGLYVITDDTLTPDETVMEQVENALKGGAKIVQLRDKKNTYDSVKQKAIAIQNLCREYDALFVLNDHTIMAIEMDADGLHIGKSDHDKFKYLREHYKGVIGVSCYGDVEMAKEFEKNGADYVAFGSFYTSPTKPNSNIIPLDVLEDARKKLSIPVCAIGGIDTKNISTVMKYQPHMVSLISDIWKSEDITDKSKFYASQF